MAETVIDQERNIWSAVTGTAGDNAPAPYVTVRIGNASLVMSPDGAMRFGLSCTRAAIAAGAVVPVGALNENRLGVPLDVLLDNQPAPVAEAARCACCGKAWVDAENGYDTCDICRARQ